MKINYLYIKDKKTLIEEGAKLVDGGLLVDTTIIKDEHAENVYGQKIVCQGEKSSNDSAQDGYLERGRHFNTSRSNNGLMPAKAVSHVEYIGSDGEQVKVTFDKYLELMKAYKS